MNPNRVTQILKESENIRLEFKEATVALPKNLFETVCAFLNRDGGDILLGISDNGTIKGLSAESADKMMVDLVNLSNNQEKLNPPFILFPRKLFIKDKIIIHLQVPASSQVHKTNNSVYDRSNEGDFKVTQAYQIAEIYNRKRNHYTEGIIYSSLNFSDFNKDLFIKVRSLIRNYNANHPWLGLSDEKLLEKSGLWKRDFQTSQEGYTLASVLLFGKLEVIQQILPHYKIDALVRIKDLDRYDDREYIQTNLIEAYEQLMAFVNKHLSDKFFMEGEQRISLRTKIFREVVANLIIHREYTNAHPCSFVIYPDRVETENANNPHGEGPIDPYNFAPFPKNPIIAKFFIQLGWVEELGSGILNVNKVIKQYAGNRKAQFIEGATFKILIPVNHENDTVSDTVSDTVNDTVNLIIDEIINEIKSDISPAIRERWKKIVIAIFLKPGLKSHEIAKIVEKSEASIRRDIQKINAIVSFKGSPKTGGYFVNKVIQKRLLKQKGG